MYLHSFSIYLCLNVKWLIVHKFVHLLKDPGSLWQSRRNYSNDTAVLVLFKSCWIGKCLVVFSTVFEQGSDGVQGNTRHDTQDCHKHLGIRWTTTFFLICILSVCLIWASLKEVRCLISEKLIYSFLPLPLLQLLSQPTWVWKVKTDSSLLHSS